MSKKILSVFKDTLEKLEIWNLLNLQCEIDS